MRRGFLKTFLCHLEPAKRRERSCHYTISYFAKISRFTRNDKFLDTPHTSTGRKGFSLIEMSVVILIVGLIAGAGFSILNSSLNRNDYSNTKAKIAEIKKAMQRYYTKNSKLPCPANRAAKYEDSDYGTDAYGGSCTTASIVGNTVRISNLVRQGAVPTRALDLADEMMYDEYGMKFTYAVTEAATTSAADGIITINDGIPTTITTSAVYVIVSHGSDKKGAYTAGGAIGIACAITLGRDNENCDNNPTATNTTFTSAQFNDLSRGEAPWFDDVIGWATKYEVTGGSTGSCGYTFYVDSTVGAGGTVADFVRPTKNDGSTATIFRVLAIGGGGGGGGNAVNSGGGGGGGSGKVDVATIPLNSDPTTITIGRGRTGGPTPIDGENTTISTVLALGGTKGTDGNISAAAGGNGGAGGIAGTGGYYNSTYATTNGSSQASFTITKFNTTVSDGTDTITFKCAKFDMPTIAVPNTVAWSGGNGGNGITSPQAPKFGVISGGGAGLYTGCTPTCTNGMSGTLGGGGGGSASPGSGGGGGNGGGTASGYNMAGGGGGYGGGGGGGKGGAVAVVDAGGGGGGGYGGGRGGGYNGSGGTGGGGGGHGFGYTYGGFGGTGYGAGGGGGYGSGGTTGIGGGGGGGNGLVYIEWDM